MRMRLRMGFEAGLGVPVEAAAAEAAGEGARWGIIAVFAGGTEEVAEPGDWAPGTKSELGRTRGLVMECPPRAGGLTGLSG